MCSYMQMRSSHFLELIRIYNLKKEESAFVLLFQTLIRMRTIYAVRVRESVECSFPQFDDYWQSLMIELSTLRPNQAKNIFSIRDPVFISRVVFTSLQRNHRRALRLKFVQKMKVDKRIFSHASFSYRVREKLQKKELSAEGEKKKKFIDFNKRFYSLFAFATMRTLHAIKSIFFFLLNLFFFNIFFSFTRPSSSFSLSIVFFFFCYFSFSFLFSHFILYTYL